MIKIQLNKFKQDLRKLYPEFILFIQISLVFTSFFFLLNIKDEYDFSNARSRIKHKIENMIEKCGKNYYASWIVVEDVSKNPFYYFEDVIGCNPTLKPSCAFSVKDSPLNPFYNEAFHNIKPETLKKLNEMENGTAFYTEDFASFLGNDPTINEAFKSVNHKPFAVALSVSKNFKNNLIHVFWITKTKAEDKSCERSDLVPFLEELSSFARNRKY